MGSLGLADKNKKRLQIIQRIAKKIREKNPDLPHRKAVSLAWKLAKAKANNLRELESEEVG